MNLRLAMARAAHPELHKGPITGITPTGMLMRGNHVANMRDDEMESLEPSHEMHARFFCMWREADLAEYIEIMQFVVDGYFRVLRSREIDCPDDDNKPSLKLWLEWAQLYVEPQDPAANKMYAGGVSIPKRFS